MANLFDKYIKVKDAKKDHAVLSASGSERWLSCPASVRLSQGIAGVDNEWNVRGTHAHTLLQFILENKNALSLLAKPEAAKLKKHIGLSEDQLDSVMVAVEYVQAQSRGKMYVEKKVELDGVGFGTADVILYNPFGTLHVIDYKHGKYKVEPEENSQGLYYAVAAADLFGWDFKDALITIVQPNAAHPRGPIRTWKTTHRRLEQAQERFRRGAAATKKKDAPVVPDSKYCFFCPARPKCPAQMKIKERNIMSRFER